MYILQIKKNINIVNFSNVFQYLVLMSVRHNRDSKNVYIYIFCYLRRSALCRIIKSAMSCVCCTFQLPQPPEMQLVKSPLPFYI